MSKRLFPKAAEIRQRLGARLVLQDNSCGLRNSAQKPETTKSATLPTIAALFVHLRTVLSAAGIAAVIFLGPAYSTRTTLAGNDTSNRGLHLANGSLPSKALNYKLRRQAALELEPSGLSLTARLRRGTRACAVARSCFSTCRWRNSRVSKLALLVAWQLETYGGLH